MLNSFAILPNSFSVSSLIDLPEDATPEQVKEWHETEGKWWGDRALMFVVIASLIQFGAMGFMLFNFWVIDLMTN